MSPSAFVSYLVMFSKKRLGLFHKKQFISRAWLKVVIKSSAPSKEKHGNFGLFKVAERDKTLKVVNRFPSVFIGQLFFYTWKLGRSAAILSPEIKIWLAQKRQSFIS